MRAAWLIAAAFSAMALAGSAWAAEDVKARTEPKPTEGTDSVEAMKEDFLKMRFGMFIHFNMETFKGAQWVVGYASPADFNPGGRVDTDAWAEAAKSAGMTYAVLTAKHVSGFCLWDSKHTTFDVFHPDCPYKEDLVAQFINSFKGSCPERS